MKLHRLLVCTVPLLFSAGCLFGGAQEAIKVADNLVNPGAHQPTPPQPYPMPQPNEISVESAPITITFGAMPGNEEKCPEQQPCPEKECPSCPATHAECYSVTEDKGGILTYEIIACPFEQQE